MLEMGSEPANSSFWRSKTVHVLERVARQVWVHLVGFKCVTRRSRWPCSVRRRSVDVCCRSRGFESQDMVRVLCLLFCCVGKRFCYRLVQPFVCDLQTSSMRRPRPQLGCDTTAKKKCVTQRRCSTKIILCRWELNTYLWSTDVTILIG